MCKQLKSLNIREGFTKFQVDSRVVKFLKAAEVGKPIPGLQPEVLPASGASSAPQLADQFKGLKRTASMSIDNSLSKKRRSSILYINSTLGNDNSLQLNTQMINQLNSRQQMMNDKNTMLAYQQMYGNRRHSYQPLTSFQEQQFAFYQTSPMTHNNQMNMMQSPIHQAHLSPSPYPPVSPISRDIKTDRSMSTPFIYHGQYTPQSNNQMLRSGNQSSPLYPQSPANIYPQSPVTDIYNNSSNSTWPQWQSPK